jgi:uncharacterized protein
MMGAMRSSMTELIQQRRAEVSELCTRHQVKLLELFGSAAGNEFDPQRSDLDFLVEFLPMPPSAHSRCYFRLWFALEDLFGRKVDLVEALAVANPYFLQSIKHSRQTLYAA